MNNNYNIGDFIAFLDPVSKKVSTTGTIIDVRKHEAVNNIYKVFHQESGFTYEYPQWHLTLHTISSKQYEEKYGQ